MNWHRRKVKHFLRWLHGCKSVKDRTPEPVDTIQQCNKKVLPKPILSRREIRQLLDACYHQRDRSLVYTTYESGARAGEILAVKIADVEFDQTTSTAVLRLSESKTRPRIIRLVESVPDLMAWLDQHPAQGDPEAWLWVSLKGGKTPLTRDGFELMLRNLGKKAGLNKRVHPHLLRHSRATYDATYMSDAEMRVKYGWSKRSRMPEVYTHLSGKDLDETVLKHYGVKVAANKDDLEPKSCPWCRTVNSPSARFCQGCNAPLNIMEANKETEKQRRRMEFVDRFIERILQEVPEQSKNILAEMRKELAELTE